LIEPGPADVAYALSFGGPAFSSADWIKRYTVEPYRITLTRNNDVLGGIAYLEYLLYTCGYGQSDLDEYFNDQNFAIVFGDYDSYAAAGFCESEGLALYEFEVVENGVPFQARYWVRQVSDTRLLVLMLVFPTETPEVLEQYSRSVFPQFTACE
jgi:hypothetical protein